MENNQTKEPYVGFQDPGESAQGGCKLDNDRLSQDPWCKYFYKYLNI